LTGGESVLLEVTGDELLITGSTFNALALTSIPATVTGDTPNLPLSVDYERFAKIAGAMTDDVQVSVVQNSVKIASGATTARLNGIPEPNPRTWKETNPVFACEIDDLRMAVGRVNHFVAPEKDNRHNLTGIVLDIDGDGHVTLSTSNGYAAARLSLRVVQLPLVGFAATQVIIPSGPLKDALKAMAIVGGQVQVELAEGQTTLRAPSLCWSLRRIDGHFPDLRAHCPDNDAIDTWITVDRDRIITSLKLAGLFASKADSTKQDVVHLGALLMNGEYVLTVASAGSEHGDFGDIIPATIDGTTTSFKCAGPMLRDAASAVVGERLKIGIVTPEKPFIVVGEDAGPDDFQVLTPCV
jgi:DNA polymerase III sliding clamp (beta) subunit (PCNA family)